MKTAPVLPARSHVALHEAGHCLVAFLLGIPILEVMVDPQRIDDPGMDGWVTFDEQRAPLGAILAMLTAGAVAEHLGGWECEAALNHARHDLAAVARRTAGMEPDAVADLLRRSMARSAQLCQERRADLLALADYLAGNAWVSGNGATKFLERRGLTCGLESLRHFQKDHAA
ncbi:MAG: hypothetical protein AB7O62_08575 [Pirellulales bacterium]